MQFFKTHIPGAWLIGTDLLEDERGFFARTFCSLEFEQHGLNPHLAQCNISFNRKKGTLRGMHFQARPHQEAKLVRCTRGAIHDVVLDLRPASPTFLRWEAAELSADNHRMMYVPEGCAHGFQSLVDDSEVFYQMTEFYHPECSKGVRWDDPMFGIAWPLASPILSDRDRNYPLYSEELK